MGFGIHLLMPMAGAASRFVKNGVGCPKPLLPLHGKPLFFWAVRSLEKFVPLHSLIFVVLAEHVASFQLDRVILELFPQAKIHVIEHVLNGPVLSCLEGLKVIDDEEPIVINDCDHLFLCETFYRFCRRSQSSLDGALLTFDSDDTKFSFLELDVAGNVMRTVEKQAVSRHAICGAYFFRNRRTLEQAAATYLQECMYSEFFVSGLFNVMAARGARIRHFLVDSHLAFGTPEEYEAAKISDAFGALI